MKQKGVDKVCSREREKKKPIMVSDSIFLLIAWVQEQTQELL